MSEGDGSVGNTLPPSTTTDDNFTTTTATAGIVITTYDNVAVIIRTTALVVLLCVSLIGNSLLVLSVSQASKSRYNPFNAFLLSMAAYALVECSLTMSLATGFSIEKVWMFGDFLAGFNASFIQLQNVGVLLTIVAMSIDRYIAVTRVSNYHTHSSVHHANYVVLYTWIHAFVFSLPLLFQNQMLGVTARPFVERTLCGLVEGTTLTYTSLLVIICFFIPMVLTVTFLTIVIVKAKQERNRIIGFNSTQYVKRCIQESMILSEARCAKYVCLLFSIYMLFKGPYIIIDIMTQINYGPAFHSVYFFNTTTNQTDTITVDGARFYYQTILSWLMFSYSAVFPFVTLIYFKDHWRRLKKWISCSAATVSIANSGARRGVNPRHLRQKQRRQMQRINSDKNKKRKRKNKKTSPVNSIDIKKPPSSISSNITSEKVTVNGNSAHGEVLFRIPVLYAANDGLHLVASDKQISRKNENNKKKENALSDNHTINRNSNMGSTDSTLTTQTNVDNSELSTNETNDDEFRPSSVIDKRVDVAGSRDCLRDEDVFGMMSDFDPDDDTESELNESANSRTLIWPHRQSATFLTSMSGNKQNSAPVWKSEVFDSKAKRKRDDPKRFSASVADDIPHPHTPTPPPDQDFGSCPALRTREKSFEESSFVCDSNKLPVLKSKTVSTSKINKLFGQGSSTSLRSDLVPDCDHESVINEGCDRSPDNTDRRKSSDVSRELKHWDKENSVSQNHSSHNKVHPNHKQIPVAFNDNITPPSCHLPNFYSGSWPASESNDMQSVTGSVVELNCASSVEDLTVSLDAATHSRILTKKSLNHKGLRISSAYPRPRVSKALTSSDKR